MGPVELAGLPAWLSINPDWRESNSSVPSRCSAACDGDFIRRLPALRDGCSADQRDSPRLEVHTLSEGARGRGPDLGRQPQALAERGRRKKPQCSPASGGACLPKLQLLDRHIEHAGSKSSLPRVVLLISISSHNFLSHPHGTGGFGGSEPLWAARLESCDSGDIPKYSTYRDLMRLPIAMHSTRCGSHRRAGISSERSRDVIARSLLDVYGAR